MKRSVFAALLGAALCTTAFADNELRDSINADREALCARVSKARESDCRYEFASLMVDSYSAHSPNEIAAINKKRDALKKKYAK